MRGAVALVALAGLLGGCASSIMSGFVGKPVESVMVRYGQPVSVFDMPDGRRAFQWQINSSFVMPGSAHTNTNIFAPPGSFAQVNSFTTYTPAQQINSSCLYTMYGEWRGGMWVLVGYEKPNLMCE